MRLARLLATAFALALLTTSLAAQSRLETNSGRVYTGEVLSDDGQRVEIKTTSGATMQLPYEQLTSKTRYRLRRDRTGDDGLDQLELAEWCVDELLYWEARRHYRKALEVADDTQAETINTSLAAARTRASREILERAQAMSQQGKPKEARRLLGTLVQELPDEEASQEAKQLLAAETAKRKDSMLGPAEATDGEPAEDAPRERARRADGEFFSKNAYLIMAPVIEAYRSVVEQTNAGLQLSDSRGTKSIKEYKAGLDAGMRGLAAMDKIRTRPGMDVEQKREIGEALKLAEARLEEAIVECRLHLADTYLLRSSYKQADDVVKEGLGYYPRNERLKAASARIAAANENKDGGGWLITREPRPRPTRPTGR